MTMRNPAHPGALTAADVQPGVCFTLVHPHTQPPISLSGMFTSTIGEDGWFTCCILDEAGNLRPPKEENTADWGIIQHAGGDTNVPFWSDNYVLRRKAE